MKIQDVVFLLVFVLLLVLKKPRWFVYAGLGSLFLAMPLFYRWIFFTAERLTWYAAAFFAVAILFSLKQPHKVQ